MQISSWRATRPVLDRADIPHEIREIRRRIFERIRRGSKIGKGRKAQKKIERQYRIDIWRSEWGKKVRDKFPTLPAQVTMMIPEIECIANSESDFILLIEIAKSAKTRNLIGTVLTEDCDILGRLYSVLERENRPAIRDRIERALERWRKLMKSDKGQQERL